MDRLGGVADLTLTRTALPPSNLREVYVRATGLDGQGPDLGASGGGGLRSAAERGPAPPCRAPLAAAGRNGVRHLSEDACIAEATERCLERLDVRAGALGRPPSLGLKALIRAGAVEQHREEQDRHPERQKRVECDKRRRRGPRSAAAQLQRGCARTGRHRPAGNSGCAALAKSRRAWRQASCRFSFSENSSWLANFSSVAGNSSHGPRRTGSRPCRRSRCSARRSRCAPRQAPRSSQNMRSSPALRSSGSNRRPHERGRVHHGRGVADVVHRDLVAQRPARSRAPDHRGRSPSPGGAAPRRRRAAPRSLGKQREGSPGLALSQQ
jgi:hypothetical protein